MFDGDACIGFASAEVYVRTGKWIKGENLLELEFIDELREKGRLQ